MLTRSQSKTMENELENAGRLNGSESAMASPVSPAVSPTITSHGSVSIQREDTGTVVYTKSPERRIDSDFEKMVKSSLKVIMDGQVSIRKDFETFRKDIIQAVEFQGEQIDELQTKTKTMATDIVDVNTKVDNAWDTIYVQQKHHFELNNAIQNLERHSRRNNLRIIGVPEVDGENVENTVNQIFAKFGREDIEIERAHRDGRRFRPRGRNQIERPRHILVKILRYKDKIDLMKRKRECLKDENYHIVEDLIKGDLEEKKFWSQKVFELYQQGIKLRFVGGLWRDKTGKKAPFYADEPHGSPIVPEKVNKTSYAEDLHSSPILRNVSKK